ncbi:metalloreductase-like protein transmembrane component [Lineolata rhizophorae]|uniref:ferric-chelate reductase (NADPH) n=1 Tax=Lineolata rhizophorae TaxID=578093 RepID=A0A6A6P2X8_9PEZI|nr:metalloreductase-like protein transmembrane component [Lineolata rhizophorae]
MPARRAAEALAQHGPAGELIGRALAEEASVLVARINPPYNDSSPGQIEAFTRDPWDQSGKYALGVVYFCVILLVFGSFLRFYHLFTDKIRTALYQEEVVKSSATSSPDTDYELSVLDTDKSTHKFFPRDGPLPPPPKTQSSVSSVGPINNAVALFRFVFYRPIPSIQIDKVYRPIVFPSLAIVAIMSTLLVFTLLYTLVPQPWYWDSMRYGAPPVAIRSGMLAIALLPFIVALSMKANFITLLTGIGHERLNVLHRWGAYTQLVLSIAHMIPFYIPAIWDKEGLRIYKSYFNNNGDFYVYGTGIAALVPLCFLIVHSLPVLRRWSYETFKVLHRPVAILYIAMLFWHCHNYLTSWHYLYATIAIFVSGWVLRLFFYFNFTNPWRQESFAVGDQAFINIMPENAVKITIPTKVRWRPGQYVYLRMPGISLLENHPFTIASLCSEDFPSLAGEEYRDMTVVFRPFAGWTQKVLDKTVEKGEGHPWQAWIDGPYGGMQRRIEAFDHVVLIAGGSGITAIVSQLLDLIKRMRDGKAVTKHVQVIWAVKRPETMEWFKEELRICRENAPPDTVQCQFYITGAKRLTKTADDPNQGSTRPHSLHVHDKVNHFLTDLADKRLSNQSAKRNSALIRDEAAGDAEKEKELRRENEDAITALPQAHIMPARRPSRSHLGVPEVQAPQPIRSIWERRQEERHTGRDMSHDVYTAAEANTGAFAPTAQQDAQSFDFGFPSTPTEFQKNLMRFAFLPAAVKKRDGWSTEYGRPDISYMLRQFSENFGRRTCVFVCGPPSMRISVCKTVAQLQLDVLRDSDKDEIFLHTENYAL